VEICVQRPFVGTWHYIFLLGCLLYLAKDRSVESLGEVLFIRNETHSLSNHFPSALYNNKWRHDFRYCIHFPLCCPNLCFLNELFLSHQNEGSQKTGDFSPQSCTRSPRVLSISSRPDASALPQQGDALQLLRILSFPYCGNRN